MEPEIVTSKHVRSKLGGILLDIRYVAGKVFLVSKPGSEDFDAVIMSASLARENGIDIPEKGKSESKPDTKPDTKKKK